MTDDELISLYVDGQMSTSDAVAFDARLHNDAGLRRRVAATRLLMGEARKLPALALPRNFILARDIGAKQAQPTSRRSPSLIPNWVFRLGSAAAAAAFVVLVGAEAIAPRTTAPVFDQANVLQVTQQVVAALQETAPSAMTAIADTPQVQVMIEAAPAAPAPSPITPRMSSARSLPSDNTTQSQVPVPQPTAMPPEAKAMESNFQPSTATSAQPTATQPIATPAPTPVVSQPPVSMPTSASAGPLLTPTRILAALALMAAAVLAALGWRRPPTL